VATAEIERAAALLSLGRFRRGFSRIIRATEPGQPAAEGVENLADQARRRRGPATHAAAASYELASVLTADGNGDERETLAAIAAFIEQHEHDRSRQILLFVLVARALRRVDGR
jgi:hypothetical protein